MNNKNKNSIDQLFSEKLQNHSVKPRDLVWENLDKALDKKKGKTSGKYWFLGTLLLVLTLGSGTVFFWNASEQENQVIKQNQQVEIQQEKQKIIDNFDSKKKGTIVINKKGNQKQNPTITTNEVQKTKIKAINLSTKGTKKELNQSSSKQTKNKEEVATLQNSRTAEEVITSENNIEIQNSENKETLEENIEIQKEEETTVTLEEKQETRKAGVHLKIRLGTQAGGRDEEREEIEAEERANKKARLVGKFLKGAWNLKKEKRLGKKNNKLKKD